MRPRDIAKRLTGISTPFGGVSWEAAKVDRDVAAAVVAYLEDRRVLYAHSAAEVPGHCIESVLDTRRFLTSKLAEGGLGDELAETLRGMRASCRRFLDGMDTLGPGVLDPWEGHYHGWMFNQTLGELRSRMGIYLGVLAVAYDLPIEDNLASILPPRPEQEDEVDKVPRLTP